MVWAACCSLLWPSFSRSYGQSPGLKTRTKEEREEQLARTRRITLDIQVTNAAGSPVSDLNAADFALLDNHQQRKITSFHAIDGAALSDATRVLILLDAVNTSEDDLQAQKGAIFRYLAQSHRPFAYPTAFLLWFNGHLSATATTTDRNEVGRGFVKLTKGVHSNACEDPSNSGRSSPAIPRSRAFDLATCRDVHRRDSIAALDGIAQQQRADGGRTLLLWVGAGWPSPSVGEIPMRRNDVLDLVTVLRDLRLAQETVYSILPESVGRAETGVAEQTGKVSADPGFARPALAELVERTGGRMLRGGDSAANIAVCVHDADWYYVVSFNAPPAENGAGELRTLEIKVDRPDLEIRSMTAYFPEP